MKVFFWCFLCWNIKEFSESGWKIQPQLHICIYTTATEISQHYPIKHFLISSSVQTLSLHWWRFTRYTMQCSWSWNKPRPNVKQFFYSFDPNTHKLFRTSQNAAEPKTQTFNTPARQRQAEEQLHYLGFIKPKQYKATVLPTAPLCKIKIQ